MQLALTAVLFALLAFTNSMIPMRPRPLSEAHNATATEVSTAKPVLELRRIDRAAARNKDKDVDCSEERKPAKPNKDGKIVNTGEIEKQIIVNIENHLRPEFKINLGSGMLRNIICGNNFSVSCEPPAVTTPKGRQQTQPRTRKPPKIVLTSTMDASSEATDAITISEVTSEGTESVEPTTKYRKPRKPTKAATVIVSIPHPTDEETSSPVYDDDGKPIVVEYSVPSIGEDSDESTETYTAKKTLPTRRTTRRPTRKPQPRRTTTEATGRETTKCKWTKRPTRKTTELIAEISQTIDEDETEETTETIKRKPTKPRKRTTPPVVVTQEYSATFLDSDESTTSEPAESTEADESTESCESTEPPESTESYSVTYSQSYGAETEPEEPDYSDEEPSAETQAPVRRTTRKPRRGGKIITKLNCTDLFPPTGNKKPKRLRKRDLISLELLKMKCSDEICI